VAKNGLNKAFGAEIRIAARLIDRKNPGFFASDHMIAEVSREQFSSGVDTG